MDIYTQLGNFLTDDRLVANLAAIVGSLLAIAIFSIIIRKIIVHACLQVVRALGLHWLDGISHEAHRRLRAFLFFTTLGLMAVATAIGLVFHAVGYDVRYEIGVWYDQLTSKDIFNFGLALGEMFVLAAFLTASLKLIRTGLSSLEQIALKRFPTVTTRDLLRLVPLRTHKQPHDSQPGQEETIRRWFFLLERFAYMTVFLTVLWVAGYVLHLHEAVNHALAFTIRLVAIFMVARLLTLACRTGSGTLTQLGNQHLGSGPLHRYWERVTRLFPFGEKCFEAAVYISAASLVIGELGFISVIAFYGPRIVQCIGIFFTTRVLVELLHVLFNEIFGTYEEETTPNQMVQTLLPLITSLGQYVLYVGSVVIMIDVFGKNIMPILTGLGILGLAVSLGAQSLVTDVVSGFFILFENQYLVGDIVQIGDAQGRVEAISIRHTQIRDETGKLYIMPNGQIKTVINFSKGFVNAVVDVKVPVSSNLELVMRDMAEAGKRLKSRRREVLAETLIKGLVDLTPGDMTLRAITRVMPGTHLVMQCEYRRFLKEVFDERLAGKTRLAG